MKGMVKQHLVLGTAQFGMKYGITNKNEIIEDFNLEKILYHFTKNVESKVDCSTIYGNAFARLIGYIPTTKINMKFQIKDIKNKNKNLDHNFNYLLCHDWEKLNISEKISVANYLKLRKLDNSCKEIGISIYNPLNIQEAISLFKTHIIVQTPINILDQRALKVLSMENVNDGKLTIQARSIFLQGLLLEKSIKNQFLKSRDLINFYRFCKESRINQLDLCISFIKSVKFISEVIFGVSNVNEFEIFINSWEKEKIEYSWENFSSQDSLILDPRKWEIELS
jgi:aryl-alcohol dehydrogenase-like predicted oxidoreductase